MGQRALNHRCVGGRRSAILCHHIDGDTRRYVIDTRNESLGQAGLVEFQGVLV